MDKYFISQKGVNRLVGHFHFLPLRGDQLPPFFVQVHYFFFLKVGFMDIWSKLGIDYPASVAVAFQVVDFKQMPNLYDSEPVDGLQNRLHSVLGLR